MMNLAWVNWEHNDVCQEMERTNRLAFNL